MAGVFFCHVYRDIKGVGSHGWRDFIVPGRSRQVLSMDSDLRGSVVSDDVDEAGNLSAKKKSSVRRAKLGIGRRGHC